MADAARDRLADALFAMKEAVVALHYEVPEAVAADVRDHWNEVIAALRAAGVVGLTRPTHFDENRESQ